jgi:hypothetical protein
LVAQWGSFGQPYLAHKIAWELRLARSMQKILFWLDQHAEAVVAVLSGVVIVLLAFIRFHLGFTVGDLLTLLDMIFQS